MAEESKVSAPEASTETMPNHRIRLYVGGLGGSVTEEDLKKTFSSLGAVETVDIVRTKGRSFAYINFNPSSEMSLVKLFSTYNGCSWKGGKLKLEKAKEHYLDRLRREWSEDAELENCVPTGDTDAEKTTISPAKPKKDLYADKMQIRIFFPQLRKMKSLPFSGTGKHKYSFQRLEAASRPVHVCGCCDEHSVPSAKHSRICDANMQDGGVHEEEIDLMRSVMSKLFERDNGASSIGMSHRISAGRDAKTNFFPVKDSDEKEGEDDDDDDDDVDDDDDDLIINVVGGHKKPSLLERWKQEISLTDERTRSNKSRSPDDVPAGNQIWTRKEKVTDSMKKRAAVQTENNTKVVYPTKRTKLQTQINYSVGCEKPSTIEKESTSRQANMTSTSMQKAAWKNLLGDGDSNTFSLSSLRPVDRSDNTRKEKVPDSMKKRPAGQTEKNTELVCPSKRTKLQTQVNDSEECEKPSTSKEKSTSKQANMTSTSTLKAAWKNLLGDGDSSTFSLSNIRPVNLSDDKESSEHDDSDDKESSEHGVPDVSDNKEDEPASNLINPDRLPDERSDDVSSEPSTGSSWLQKSPWTQLVGGESCSFSISQIMPRNSEDSQTPVKNTSNNVYSAKNDDAMIQKKSITVAGSVGRVSELQNEAERIVNGQKHVVTSLDDGKQNQNSAVQNLGLRHKNNGDVDEPSAKVLPEPTQASNYMEADIQICPFMRTAASLKAWKSAKTALTGANKRKNK